MRVIGIVTGLVVAAAAVSVAAAESAPLAPFQFKALTAAMSLNDAQAAGLVSACSAIDQERGAETWCGLSDKLKEGGVAGVKSRRSSLKFDDGGLTQFSWEMFRSDVPTVRVAFEQRYGKPCRTATAQLQNGYGATFPSEMATWCFAEGDLILMERSLNDPLNGEFLFVTHRHREDRANPKPTVNF